MLFVSDENGALEVAVLTIPNLKLAIAVCNVLDGALTYSPLFNSSKSEGTAIHLYGYFIYAKTPRESSR